MDHHFDVVQHSEALTQVLKDLFALTLTERALTRLIGEDAVRLAKYLRHSQTEGTAGPRWGDVDDLADLLWDRGGRLAQMSGRTGTTHPMAIRLMEIADRLSFDFC